MYCLIVEMHVACLDWFSANQRDLTAETAH